MNKKLLTALACAALAGCGAPQAPLPSGERVPVNPPPVLQVPSSHATDTKTDNASSAAVQPKELMPAWVEVPASDAQAAAPADGAVELQAK